MPDFSKKAALRLYEYFNSHSLYKAGGQRTGCDLRAHITASKLRKRTGLPVKKVWCWAERENASMPSEAINGEMTLSFEPVYNEKTKRGHGYNFHVAAFIEAPDGERLVYDPVFYDGPVALEQWLDDFVPIRGLKKRISITPPWVTGFEEAHNHQSDKKRPSLVSRFMAKAVAKVKLYHMGEAIIGKGSFFPRQPSRWRNRPA